MPFLSQIGWFGQDYAECSEQREYCAFFVSNRLVSILCLFCVELVGLGTGQTKTFWAEGILRQECSEQREYGDFFVSN